MDIWLLLSRVSDVLASATTMKDVIKWLAINRQTPLAVAVERTTKTFDDRLPMVKKQLAAFLASDVVRRQVHQQSVEEERLVTWLSEEFVTRGLFFAEENISLCGEDLTKELSSDVVRVFLDNLNRALLGSSDGNVQLDLRGEARHLETRRVVRTALGELEERAKHRDDELRSKIVSDINQTLAQADASRLEPVWRNRIGLIRDRQEALGPHAALPLWEMLLEDVSALLKTDVELQSEVLTNLGACYLRTDAQDNAKDCFVKAYQLRPSSKREKLNRALVYALAGQFGMAHGFTDEVLEAYPDDPRCLAMKANILLGEANYAGIVALFQPYWDDLEKLISIQDADCCRMLGIAFLEMDLLTEARSVMQQGIRLSPSDAGLQILLATTLFRIASNSERGNLSLQEEQRDLLKKAEELLTRAVTYKRQRAITENLSDALANRAVVRIKMGHPEQALEDLEAAYGLDPDSEHVRQTYGLCLIASGKPETAIPLLELWTSNTDSPRCVELLFGAYESVSDGLSRMETYISSRHPERGVAALPAAAMESYAEALVEAGRPAAEAIITLFALNPSMKARASILRAKLQKKRGDKNGFLDELNHAVVQATQDKDLRTLALVGREYMQQSEWELAAAVFGYLGLTEWSPKTLVVQWMLSLYRSGLARHEDTILSFAQKHREANGVDWDVTQLEIAVLESRGDYSTGASLWKQLVSTYPKQVRLEVGLARSLLRSGSTSEAKLTLASLRHRRSELDPKDLMAVAGMFLFSHDGEAALELAYDAWRRAPSELEVSGGYIGIFLEVTSRFTDNLDVLETTEGTAATVEFEDRTQRTWVLSAGENVHPNEIGVDSEIGRKLVGMRIGEQVEWSEGSASRGVAKLAQLRHKYVWAFQTAIVEHPINFPTDNSLRELRVDGDDVSPVLRELDRQYEAAKEAVEAYRDHNLPYGMLATMLGKDIFETWSGLKEDGLLTLNFCLNTPEERVRELAAVNGVRSVVCDPLALFTLQLLGFLPHMRKVFDQVLVPQQVLDAVIRCRDNIQRFGNKEKGVMGKSEHGYFLTKTLPGSQQADIAFLETIIRFCSEEALIVPRPRQYTAVEEETLLSAVGDAFVTPILVVESNPGTVYYSDDGHWRGFAHGEYGVPGMSTWSLCQLLLAAQIISQRQLAQVMSTLLRNSYRSVPLDAATLSSVAVSNYDPEDPDFVLLTDYLFSQEVDLDSALGVAARFLLDLLDRVIVFGLAARFIDRILDRAFQHAGIPGVRRLRNIVAGNTDPEIRSHQVGLQHLDTWLIRRSGS